MYQSIRLLSLGLMDKKFQLQMGFHTAMIMGKLVI